MPHQHHCQVGIPSSGFPFKILTVSYHISWMDGRFTIATSNATAATVKASFSLLAVGKLKSEVGERGYNKHF